MGNLNKPLNGVGLAQVAEIMREWLGEKEDRLTGTPGQLAAFDSAGAAAARDAAGVLSELVGESTALGSSGWSGSTVFIPAVNNGETGKISFDNIRYNANNRTSNVASSNTSYTTMMARGIKFDSTAPTSIANGCIVLVYS